MKEKWLSLRHVDPSVAAAAAAANHTNTNTTGIATAAATNNTVTAATSTSLLHERVRRAGTHTMHLPFQTPLIKHGKSPKSSKMKSKYPNLSILHVVPSDVNGGDVVTWVESIVTNQRKQQYPVLLLTLSDWCELGEPLLHLLGFIEDCTIIFVPSAIYETSLKLFHRVQTNRDACLVEDAKTQIRLIQKKKQIAKQMNKKREMKRLKEGRLPSHKLNRYMKQLSVLLKQHELPSEWLTSASTLHSTVDLLRSRHQNMPIIVLNSPHN